MTTLTFHEWKQTFTVEPRFRANGDYLKATEVVFNAYIARRDGEIDQLAFESAIAWGFELHHASALHETKRAEARNCYSPRKGNVA